jgi:hypothetical protein
MMHNGASSYVPCGTVSTDESHLRHISLAAEYLHWVQNHRGHLTATAIANGDSMSRLCIWEKRATVMFSMDELIPLLMPFTLWALEAWRVGPGRESWSLWTFWTIPVRWFILAHRPHWTPSHQTWGSQSVWGCQGIHWTLWACLWSLGGEWAL